MHRPLTPPADLHEPDDVAIVVGCRASPAQGRPELRGEFEHWGMRIPMLPSPGRSDRFEVAVRAAPGTYAYKFRLADGSWILDPEQPRTVCVDGHRNSVMVVGGTEEPLLHVPTGPDLAIADDGRVVVRVGLRKAAEHRPDLHVRWDEGEGPRRTAMFVVGEEDEHWLLEAWLPVSARKFEYAFEHPDGRIQGRPPGLGQAFAVSLASLRRPEPAWWRDAILYTVFVDRFRAGGREGTWPAPTPLPLDLEAVARGSAPRSIPFARIDANQQRAMAIEQGWAGGDLLGVLEGLPHLHALGVNALHLTPVFEARSSHRYDVVDFHRVDSALGGEAALRELLEAAHGRGMKVLLDIPISHVHRDFEPFADVRRSGLASRYAEWFYIEHHPFHEGLSPGYVSYPKGAWQEPLLRTDHPAVVEFLCGVFEHWTRFGVDGFRIDAAADVPLGLVARIRAAVANVNPDAIVFAEVVAENLHRWTRRAVHAGTDFSASQATRDWLLTGRGASRVAAVLARRRFRWPGSARASIAFTSTHDQVRLRTASGQAEVARLGTLFTLLRASVPAILYGEEIGLGSHDAGRSFEDVWPDRKPMPWTPEAWDSATLELVRDAIALRRRLPALHRGDEEVYAADSEAVVGLRRTFGEQVIEAWFNAGPEPRLVRWGAGVPELRLGLGAVEHDEHTIVLGPRSAAVFERMPSPAVVEVIDALGRDNADACSAAFVEGVASPLALPRRVYLTVTERCNLRCAHCITGAPGKTAAGRARTLAPWLLTALRPVFATAEYFGFSHGGESLVSTMFTAALRAIREARADDRRYDVHLLSNGMLAEVDAIAAAVDLGLTSLAISLDGATPTLNDGLRIGGSWRTIVDNVRALVGWRDAAGADLRIGLSHVVTEGNVDSLDRFGRLALELGVDWLKIEELVPNTPRARLEWIAPDDPRVERGMAELRATVGDELVLVDHRRSPPGCPCTAEPGSALEAFLRADAFANRVAFAPCKMAWEQACIDPDGTVHAISYESPILGSLAERSFFEVWTGPMAAALRTRALTEIDVDVRRACRSR